MEEGTTFVLILALLILGPALLFWLNERITSSIRRDEIESDRSGHLRLQDDERPIGRSGEEL